ncbi:response regulator [Gilvibacter sediminis]|uniref:response regulator n=1 Tax=Gilvibacter sediminis TaxID=379071 RepID=UPI00235100DB|nr:response regulator [Gilvibacter sediminis]MDC7997039.1 response regulator [Gilvibacter sediminis]
MFKKILIAEDYDSVNHGLSNVFKELDIQQYVQVTYCDEAYLKIKRSQLDQTPFDLLITDLSFAKDHRTTSLEGGEQLIAKLKKEEINIPVIVFSVEDRGHKARYLIERFGVQGFVNKGRRGLKDLRAAIMAVHQGERYFSESIAKSVKSPDPLDIIDFDVALLQQLAEGLSQDQISNYFKSNSISPSSLSSIEKRINTLKIQFKANNTTHLIAVVKDLGII